MSGLGLLLAFAVAALIWWVSVKGLAASARSSTSAAYARRGVGLYVAGTDHDNAIAAFTESLLLNPKNVAALMGRGGAYLERKNYADAIADLTAAIQLNPDSTAAYWAYTTRGTAYLRWGNYEKAIADCTAAIQLKPDLADAYFTRSSAYAKRYGLPVDPRQWPMDPPGRDSIVADLTAAAHLISNDPEVPEFAKAILAAIPDPGIAHNQPITLTPEQRAEQQERERQWAAERERLAREQQEQQRKGAERLAAQRQRQHEEELERQREAQRQWEERKRRWEERKCKALHWGEERSRATLVVIVSVTRWLLRRAGRVLRGLTRHRRDVRVRRVLVPARWWGRKADRTLRGWSSRLGTLNEAGMRRCLWLVSAVVLILVFIVGALVASGGGEKRPEPIRGAERQDREIQSPAAVLPPNASPPIRRPRRYAVTDLGTLGGRESNATAINKNGLVVGRAETKSGDRHAFLWQSNTGMKDLGTLGGTYSVAIGINSNGEVVGRAETNSVGERAFLWQHDTGMRDINTLGGAFSDVVAIAAIGINDGGQVVGVCKRPGPAGEHLHAFLWRSGSGVQEISAMGDDCLEKIAINNRGQIVGTKKRFSAIGDDAHAFSWDVEGGTHDLGTLGGEFSSACGVNDKGQVVGSAETKGRECHVFLWDFSGRMRDLGTPLGGPKTIAIPGGLNNRGDVIGVVTRDPFPIAEAVFLYADGKMLDLDSLIDPASGWRLTSADAINDSGQIVGSGVNTARQFHALLLTPNP